jgi:hypothetical protein
MGGGYSQAWRNRGAVSPATADRIMVGLCAAVWLALVGISVAAIVALMDLGRGFHEAAGNPHTSSVLYAIIVISALIILAAIPVLVRARRTTRAEPVARPVRVPVRGASGQPIKSGYPPTRTTTRQARSEQVAAWRPALPDTAIDRIWLRGTVALIGTMGVAFVAVATATYLMAIGHYGGAWTGYVIAGLVTLAMPLIPWRHVRRLRRMLTE